MMDEMHFSIKTLYQYGESVRVTCDHQGWAVVHEEEVVYRAKNARDARTFIGGLESRYRHK